MVQEVHDLLENACKKGDKVAILEKIKLLLVQRGLAWYAPCAPGRAAVSEENRSKLGVVGSDSQVLGGDILARGWSDQRTEESSAFQKPPPPLDSECKSFNQRLIDLSDGLIPELDDIDILTVGGSHTNTFLRQVLCGVKAVVKSLSDTGEVGGRLDMEKLVVNRPEFKVALQRGMTFWVAQWQTAFIWPRLADFLQDSLNITAKLIVSEPEVMLKMNQMASAAKASGEDPINWQTIELVAAKSNPACVAWLSDFSKYVQKCGLDGQLIQELSEFTKTLQDTGVKRLLGSDFISKICSLKFGTGIHFPYIVNATVELQFAGPKVKGGFCQFVALSALNELKKADNKDNVVKGEELLCESRKLVKGLQLPRSKVTKFLGRLDIGWLLWF